MHDESSENQQAAAMADLPLPSQSQVLLYFLQSSFSLHLLLSSLSSSLMIELDLDLHPTSTNGGSIFNMPCRIHIPHPCRHGYFAKNGGSVQHRSLRIYDFVDLFFPLKSTNKLYSFWTIRVWHDFSQVYIVHYIWGCNNVSSCLKMILFISQILDCLYSLYLFAFSKVLRIYIKYVFSLFFVL